MINCTPPPENDQRKTAATIVPKMPFVVSHRPKNGQHLVLPAFVTRTSLSRFSTDQTTIRADADYKVALRETSALMEFDPKTGNARW